VHDFGDLIGGTPLGAGYAIANAVEMLAGEKKRFSSEGSLRYRSTPNWSMELAIPELGEAGGSAAVPFCGSSSDTSSQPVTAFA